MLVSPFQPEGVAQDYNRPLLIDLTQSGARFEQTIPLPLPDNVVPGSVRVKANVLGMRRFGLIL